MMMELQNCFGEESRQKTISLFPFLQKTETLFVLTRTMLFQLRILEVEMTRKYFSKVPYTLHKNQMLILFYIASLETWEIVTQTNVANALNKPITSLNYHFTKLRKEGLLNEQNSLTDKGKKVLRYLKHWDKTLDKKLRAHKIQVTIFLTKCPDLQKIKNVVFTPFTNNRYDGLKCELKGCTVMFYSSKKAVAVIPDIYGNTDEEIASAVSDFTSQLIRVLESEFEGLKVDNFKVAKFGSMHVAILDSVIAESFLLENRRCYSNGRVAVDSSHGRNELEAESGDTALEDIELLVKYESLAQENKILKERVKEVESMLENIRKKEVGEDASGEQK